MMALLITESITVTSSMKETGQFAQPGIVPDVQEATEDQVVVEILPLVALIATEFTTEGESSTTPRVDLEMSTTQADSILSTLQADLFLQEIE